MTMRNPFIAAMMLPALLSAAPYAGGDELEAEIAQAVAKVKEEKGAGVDPAAGLRTRKRGPHVVYCRREEPKGTRFPTEICYDEQGIRNMLQTKREDQANVDQIRRIQATGYVR
jgi:hypothetical protein